MRIGGLASGFDTDQMVRDLMRIQSLPLDRLYQQKVRVEAKREQYRGINTKLLRLRNAAFDLQLQSSFIARQATSSHEGVITAEATGSSNEGSYTISVEKLATPATYISAKTPEGVGAQERFATWLTDLDLTEGETVQIQLSSMAGMDPEFISIELSEIDTIQTFVRKINGQKELGINAFYDENQDRIVFNTSQTGEHAQIRFDLDDIQTNSFLNQVLVDSAGEWLTSDQGTNAELVINGLSTQRESNIFDLSGTRITLHSQSQSPIQITIERDTDKAFDNIISFVDLYNEIIDEINGKMREPFYREYPPLTDEQKDSMSDREIELWEERSISGLLRGDRMLSSILADIRLSLTSSVQGLDGLASLTQIGINTGAWHENGKLHVNESQLRAALVEDSDQVMRLFTNNSDREEGESGIARRLHTIVNSSITRLANTAGREANSYDQSALSDQIRRMESQMVRIEDRLHRVEERYWAQFTAMERALSDMYAQSDWLYQQLAGLGN